MDRVSRASLTALTSTGKSEMSISVAR